MIKKSHLSIQLKIVLVFTTVFISMYIILNSFVMTHYMQIFEDFERESITEQMVRTERTFNKIISNTANITEDWAARDDSYEFLKDQDIEYIERNFSADTFEALEMNVIVLMDNDGHIFYGKTLTDDKRAVEELDHDDELYTYLDSLIYEIINKNELKGNNGFEGVITVQEYVLIVAVKPVTKSDYSGESPGYIIFGKEINEELTNDLSVDLVTDLYIKQVDYPCLEDSSTALEGDFTSIVRYNEIEDNKLEVHMYFEGLGLDDYICITEEIPRDIMQKGLLTTNFIRIILPMMQISVLIILLSILRRVVLSKLTFINKEMALITKSGKVTKRINYDLSNDELRDLADNINKMLDSNERLFNEVGIVNEELEEKVLARTLELEKEVSERIRIQEEITFMAYHDSLTSLPNRLLFEDRAEQAIAASQRSRNRFAVIYIDLDGFKNINDTLGHGYGDEVLILVGKRLVDILRKNDTVSRVGGDEFSILINGYENKSDLINILEKITGCFKNPFVLAGKEYLITCSMGVAEYPVHGKTIDDLVKRSDDAMYQAKERGKNMYVMFNPVSDTQTQLKP